MTKNFENGLFIFRRDLRVIDNNSLNLLNEKCKNIFAIFIFTPEQVGDNNKYKSDNSVEFMIESLKNLSEYISKFNGQLYTFYGHNEKIIEECIKAFKTVEENIICPAITSYLEKQVDQNSKEFLKKLREFNQVLSDSLSRHKELSTTVSQIDLTYSEHLRIEFLYLSGDRLYTAD